MTSLPNLVVPQTLRDYAVERHHTYGSLCSLLEITPWTVREILMGTRRPSLIIALRIECFTGGRVPAHIWWPKAAWEKINKSCESCHGEGRVKAQLGANRRGHPVTCRRCMGTGKRLYELKEEENETDGIGDYTVTGV